MTPKARYLFLDLETTDLDPARDVILEAGCILTDASLNQLASGEWVVWQAPTLLDARLSPYVREMHTQSGLLAAVAQSKRDCAGVERDILRMLTPRADFQTVSLAGFGPHFDMGFLRHHMPALAAFLHYRLLDVRSVQMAVEAITGLPAVYERSVHRALADAQLSLSTLRELGRFVRLPDST